MISIGTKDLSLDTIVKMNEVFIDEESFTNIDFTQKPLKTGVYECCTFLNCNFGNADFSLFRFTGCTFKDCNLSLVKLINTAFTDVEFSQCKMLGVRFDTCNPLGLSFRFKGCSMDNAVFHNLEIRKMQFDHCRLHEADFTDAVLPEASFMNCDLEGSRFENTILEKADFSTAINFQFDPELNKIKGARFSVSGLAGLLTKYNLKID